MRQKKKKNTYAIPTPGAPDIFPASPIPSHFHPISLHFLLIWKSIVAPAELSVWNSVTQNLLLSLSFLEKEFQTSTRGQISTLQAT